MERLLAAALALCLCVGAAAREKTCVNLHWKYHKGEAMGAEAPAFDDGKWADVNLPHDAAIYGAFERQGEGRSPRNGFRPLAQGWYRRHIGYDEGWRGKRVLIEFEGVYRDAKVYANGEKVAEDVLLTAGKPARIAVAADTKSLKANGLDLAYLDYTVVDKDGNVCADDMKLNFKVAGQGCNAGVASGDLLSGEPWQAESRTTHNGHAQLIARSADKAGKVRITATAKGMKSVTTGIKVEL